MVLVAEPVPQLTVVPPETISAAEPRHSDYVRYLAPMMYLYAIAMWAMGVMLVGDGAPAGQYGLLATRGGLLLAVAMVATVATFLYALAARHLALAAVGIGIAILVQRVSVTLVTEIPIYTWTYKHIGLVDYLLVNHELAPESVDVYNQWPGFFTAMAWFTTVAGVDPVTVAHWFAPATHLVTALLVAALAVGLGLDKRAALAAAMLVELCNWVGQDYYSPQAVALILATACLTLLAYSRRYPAAAYLSVLVFASLVATHQLTPVWLCAAVVALAALRQIRPLWLPVVYVVITLAYVVPRLGNVSRYGIFTGSNPMSNASSNVPTTGSAGRLFTMHVDRSLSVALWVAAIVCFLILWRRVGAPWAAGIMAFSSMLLLGGQSYGGEAIFRVFLYSLPGCAVLIAPVLVGLLDGRRRLARLVATPLVTLGLVALCVASMQGYYGGWSYLTMTRTQLEQSRWLLARNPEGATITVLAPAGWPERPSADYVGHATVDADYDKPLVTLKESLSDGFPTSSDIDRMEQWTRGSGKTVYLVLPRQAGTYSDYYGLFRPGAMPALIDQLSSRPAWNKVIDDENTVVFTYAVQK
ncbi:hypothetical protein H7K45_09750 [Mycobacterium yunnanensis]|uniref:Uncharacterized protein n=1 Tax=Mycobacterium yunnanensis TaxID=368477 RepID=A0A9X2YYD9_9MYCO|nr:hypothetical protein [Mycobacterium yunnanensis]MCV7420820.1 hypothetical protein [Mycobacterium yunnanensis]